jgi:hypothetical protein
MNEHTSSFHQFRPFSCAEGFLTLLHFVLDYEYRRVVSTNLPFFCLNLKYPDRKVASSSMHVMSILYLVSTAPDLYEPKLWTLRNQTFTKQTQNKEVVRREE